MTVKMTKIDYNFVDTVILHFGHSLASEFWLTLRPTEITFFKINIGIVNDDCSDLMLFSISLGLSHVRHMYRVGHKPDHL